LLLTTADSILPGMPLCNRHTLLPALLATALCVYLFAHRAAILSPYVINDDVRQQVYWMQQYQDDRLYAGDYPTRYASAYVPWGVQLVYAAAAPFVNPVQFSKVLTALLFLFSVGMMFLLARRLAGQTAALMAACIFCYFGFFLGAISGGLSRAFVFPMLLWYLYCLADARPAAAALVAGLQSLFNPYLFVLCFCTHLLFLLQPRGLPPEAVQAGGAEKRKPAWRRLLLPLLPLAAGGLLLAVRHLLLSDEAFGDLVTPTDMAGQVVYTAAGRYPILPVPSLLFELVRPFVTDLPRNWTGIVAGLAGLGLMAGILFRGLQRRGRFPDLSGLRFFAYLLAASLLLFLLARVLLMQLFLPRRYLEYSLTVFYCIASAVLLGQAVEALSMGRKKLLLLVGALLLLGAVRLQDVAIYDYGARAPLYRFLAEKPVDSLMAGHPALMDNVLTFARRKVLVSYELSHTWYRRYWSVLQQRTRDLFVAYYAEDPATIRHFCRRYGVDYLVVRKADFEPGRIAAGTLYFQPFGEAIRDNVGQRRYFAVLDTSLFPPLYDRDGVRVITPQEVKSRAATVRSGSPEEAGGDG